jgi:hypothetical protein
MAGVTCARLLADEGHAIRVFEKSRGLGGRMATRRSGAFQFDHGAQLLRFEDPDAHAWLDRCDVAVWTEANAPTARVGVPGMKDLLAPLARDLDIAFSAEVTALTPSTSGWLLETAASRQTFDRVVLAAPAPQILRIADALETEVRDALAGVAYDACQALMVGFAAHPGWSPIRQKPDDVFELILRDSSKPARPEGEECWVAHASEAWSRPRLDIDREDVADALLQELRARHGPLPEVRFVRAHRWRFSQVSVPLGRPFARSRDGTLVAGGDWALGRTAEEAFHSGRAMAHHVIDTLG